MAMIGMPKISTKLELRFYDDLNIPATNFLLWPKYSTLEDLILI